MKKTKLLIPYISLLLISFAYGEQMADAIYYGGEILTMENAKPAYAENPLIIKDIKILGTVFQGKLFLNK
jgi:hypothetical protein